MGGGAFGVVLVCVCFKACAAAVGKENQINKGGGWRGWEIVRHVLGSFGCGGCYKLAAAGHGGAVVTVRPLQGVFKGKAVVYLVESVALGLVTDKAGGYGADMVGGGHVVGS
jgi:hypothetical protein